MVESNSGWIKIHRDILEWEWYDDINTKVLFIHLLLKCNHADGSWRGSMIKKGQIITSYGNLAKETGLTTQNVRTSISRLKSTGELTYESTSKYSLLTINNYDKYQTSNKRANKQLTNNQQTSNNKQEEEEEEELKKVSTWVSDFETKSELYIALIENLSKYYKMEDSVVEVQLEKFYLYWTEKSERARKSKWEKQSAFDVKRRLYTWFNNLIERSAPKVGDTSHIKI